jgi:hypothetical protein
MPRKISSTPGIVSPSREGWRYAYAMQLLNQAVGEFEAIGALKDARPHFQELMEILARRRAQRPPNG